MPPERAGVLDRLSRALRQERNHRMGGVAGQRDPPVGVGGDRRPHAERPGPPVLRPLEHAARLARPRGEGAPQRVDVGLAVPGVAAGLVAPAGFDGRDEIDDAPVAQRIMDEMGARAEREVDLGAP